MSKLTVVSAEQLGLPLVIDPGSDVTPQFASQDVTEHLVYPKMPHPIPYQGSKRALAPRILALIKDRNFKVLYEPFAGSAAITIAAAFNELAQSFIIGDSLASLVGIWQQIIDAPETIADEYEAIWSGYIDGDKAYYTGIRDQFNSEGGAARLLYLLARCVKNAPRFNRNGAFNQSPDPRRRGMRPEKMRTEIMRVSKILAGKTTAVHGDFEETIASATSADLVYMDPPYEGTTTGVHKRYHQGLGKDRLTAALQSLAGRRVPFILSYDGRCGETTYGDPLPAETFDATHLEINAGRSSQATLNGRNEVTIESLYVSNSLLA